MKTGKINNTDKLKPHHQYPILLPFRAVFLFNVLLPLTIKGRKKKPKTRKKNQPYQIFLTLHRLLESCMCSQVKRRCNAKTPEIHTAPGIGSSTRQSTDRGFFHMGSTLQLLFSYRGEDGDHFFFCPLKMCATTLIWSPATI